MATALEILAATMIVSFSGFFVVARGVGAVAYAQSLTARSLTP